MNHAGTVTLDTERLILRRFGLPDSEAMFKNYAGDTDVVKYLVWGPHENEEECRSEIVKKTGAYENPDYYDWAIVLKSLGEPIGAISAINIVDNYSVAEVAYWIGSKWWNSGISTEALKAVIEFLFEQVGANRIHARHHTANPGSGRVMTKCGMVFEGVARQAAFIKGRYTDQAVYSILYDDYKSSADTGNNR